MFRFLRFTTFCVAIAASSAAVGEVVLSATAYDTPGLPGYKTYDIIASSPEGFVNGFSFYGKNDGISGPLYQATAEVDFLATGGFRADSLFANDGSSADSHWLVSEIDGLHIGASQSANGLYGAYALLGSSPLRDSLRSMPLVRLVTNDPTAVSLTGDFVVEQFWNDGTALGSGLFSVNALLSDIPIATAPVYDSFPEVPTDVLAERQRHQAKEAEWEAQRVRWEEQQRLREERGRQYQLDREAAEQRRLEELQRQAEIAEQLELEQQAAQQPVTLDPPTGQLRESNLAKAIREAQERQGVRVPVADPTEEGGFGTIDFFSVGQIDWRTHQLYIDIDTAITDSNVILRDIIDPYPMTLSYASDAITFSSLGLAAGTLGTLGTVATPEPGAGLLVAIGMAGLAGRCRRESRQ